MKNLITIGLVLVYIFIAHSFTYASVGEIEKIEGKVFYRENSTISYKKANPGLSLENNYWIKTGQKSWVVIKLSDGSRFTLSENTEFEISDYLLDGGKKHGVFYVAQGKLRATVVKVTGQTTNYRIKTPTAVAGIKGTEFMLLNQGPANVFFGNEDVAYISGYDTAEKPLTADTMVQNTRGFTPTEPVKVEPGTLLYEAKKGLYHITAATPPIDWEISGALPHIIARWNINYGHYLADSGRYEEALYVFQIALDLSDNPEIQSDARLERGTVYSRFLKNHESALKEYNVILEKFRDIPQAETALYLKGVTLYELLDKKEACKIFLQYKKDYPTGRYITNVETFLKLIEDEK